jgi:hypothetical protein
MTKAVAGAAPTEFRAPAETILGLYHELALACRTHRVFTPDCPDGERPQRLLLATAEVADRLGVTIEVAPDPPDGAGAAVRRIDLRPRGVRGFIRAAFHADDPEWGLTWDGTAPS